MSAAAVLNAIDEDTDQAAIGVMMMAGLPIFGTMASVLVLILGWFAGAVAQARADRRELISREALN